MEFLNTIKVWVFCNLWDKKVDWSNIWLIFFLNFFIVVHWILKFICIELLSINMWDQNYRGFTFDGAHNLLLSLVVRLYDVMKTLEQNYGLNISDVVIEWRVFDICSQNVSQILVHDIDFLWVFLLKLRKCIISHLLFVFHLVWVRSWFYQWILFIVHNIGKGCYLMISD